MRKSTLILVLGIVTSLLTMAVPAAEPNVVVFPPGQGPQWEQLTHQRLDDAAALENLQHSNPRHYAIARRILAAANDICDASKDRLILTKYDAKTISCAQRFWLTSFPAKRALEFRIDDTVYSALVVADQHAKLDPIH